MSKPVAVLFDVDGTLVASGGAGTAAWRWSFDTHFGEPVDIGEHTDPGTTDPVVARRSFTGAYGRDPSARELARLISGYLQRLPIEIDKSDGYRVLSGVEDALGSLHDGGVLIGLTTGLLEGAAHAKLARGGLNGYFCFGGYGSDSPDRTELTRHAIAHAGAVLGGSVEPSDVMVVGDTPKDVEAAHAAGAVAVAVASGDSSIEELRAASPAILIDSMSDFEPALP